MNGSPHRTTADARTTHRRESTNALPDMTARGMSVEKTARMAGTTPGTVQGYLTPGT